MVYSRSESMQSTTKRHPAEMQGRIGCDAQGRITGMEFEGRFNTGAYSSWGPTVANRVPVHVSGPYFTPQYQRPRPCGAYQRPGFRRVSRLWRAARGAVAGNAL